MLMFHNIRLMSLMLITDSFGIFWHPVEIISSGSGCRSQDLIHSWKMCRFFAPTLISCHWLLGEPSHHNWGWPLLSSKRTDKEVISIETKNHNSVSVGLSHGYVEPFQQICWESIRFRFSQTLVLRHCVRCRHRMRINRLNESGGVCWMALACLKWRVSV